MGSGKFNLDLFEKMLPLNFDDETSQKVIDIVFWSMEQVLGNTKRELMRDLDEPLGGELWSRSCALISQNKAMLECLTKVAVAGDLEEAVTVAYEGMTMGEPKLASEMLLDRDIAIVDRLRHDLIKNLTVNECQPPAELVVETTCGRFKKTLANER